MRRAWFAVVLLAAPLAAARDDKPMPDPPRLSDKPFGARMPKAFAQEYDASFGIRLNAVGPSRGFTAVTVLPLDWPEQKLELVNDRTVGGVAQVHKVGDGGCVLVFKTKPMRAGDTAYAIRDYRITVKTIPRDWKASDFPAKRPPPKGPLKMYVGSTPGIQTSDATIQKLARQLAADKATDLEKLEAIFSWVQREIEYKQGKFTSAKTAIANRIGDCEEKSAAFIALARAVGIPARTVWTPGHCWAEFHLVDNAGEGRWLPAETTSPPWFGCRGVATIVLQKGDNYRPPEWTGRPKRLISSYCKGVGAAPQVEFVQDIKPASKPDPKAAQ